MSNCEFIDCFGLILALLPLSLGDRKQVGKGNIVIGLVERLAVNPFLHRLFLDLSTRKTSDKKYENLGTRKMLIWIELNVGNGASVTNCYVIVFNLPYL